MTRPTDRLKRMAEAGSRENIGVNLPNFEKKGTSWVNLPLQYACRLFWNTCEILHIRCPFAPHVFGIITKSKPEKVEDDDQ